MFKPKDEPSGPNDGGNDKRPSFSLSGTMKSMKRAVSTNKGQNARRNAGNERDASTGETAALTGSLANSNPFSDPPPAYSVTTAEGSGQDASARRSASRSPPRSPSFFNRSRTSRNTASTDVDQFVFLAEFDTVFLIDDSGSMQWTDGGERSLGSGDKSRWDQTREVIEQIIPVCMRYDQDGIDIYFLNDPYVMNFEGDPHRDERCWSRPGDKHEGKASHVYLNVGDPGLVRKIFNKRNPSMGTPTGGRLGEIMETYVNSYESRKANRQPPPKPLNIIVITDGAAGDPEILRSNLIEQAERLDSLCAPYHQLGVQFFQVGKDEHAARHLRELDDGLGKYRAEKELRDIVDCITHDQLPSRDGRSQLTADVVLKVVLGAVNKRLDNRTMKEGVLIRAKNRAQ